MAYDGTKKKEEFLDSHRSVDDGLAPGRIQREKKRSYKDLLQEEDKIATQVETLREKVQDSEFFPGTEAHKKKRKHSSDEFCYRGVSPLDLPSKKKKKAASSPSSADTTMDLLKAINSPLATSSKSSKRSTEKSSHSSSGHSESRKEHPKKKLSGCSGEHSVDDGSSHKSKKMKPLYVNTETLTLREPDGLKMKLILSPKEKSSAADDDSLSYSSAPAAAKKSSKKSARDEQEGLIIIKNLSFLSSSDQPKKKNMSAYQVFCKEYRTTIVSEHPGIDFGELSKKLAEVWKQLPEKDKLIWKQKAQYLQHKQNKAEATTVKRKASSSDGALKMKASPTGVISPHKKSPTSTIVVPSSPAKVPETDPIDIAAHLQLLGESLSLIGHRLQETEGMVAVSGSLSVLLDSIICALGPLACLTTQLPELNGCPKHILVSSLWLFSF
uniref:High mobility group protein 2-like 1 n=1 Tax=Zosterops lateralis melanops TaxID=1220523 RepID=A0A8D2P4N2_ZOSLA